MVSSIERVPFIRTAAHRAQIIWRVRRRRTTVLYRAQVLWRLYTHSRHNNETLCALIGRKMPTMFTKEHRRICDGRGGDGRWTMLLVCFVRTKQIEIKSFYFILATSDTFFVGAGWRKRFHFVFVNSRRFNLKRKQQHWTWPDHCNALKRSTEIFKGTASIHFDAEFKWIDSFRTAFHYLGEFQWITFICEISFPISGESWNINHSFAIRWSSSSASSSKLAKSQFKRHLSFNFS